MKKKIYKSLVFSIYAWSVMKILLIWYLHVTARIGNIFAIELRWNRSRSNFPMFTNATVTNVTGDALIYTFPGTLDCQAKFIGTKLSVINSQIQQLHIKHLIQDSLVDCPFCDVSYFRNYWRLCQNEVSVRSDRLNSGKNKPMPQFNTVGRAG